ncbi:AAA family ATPase [Kutzneria sp. NPDC052558]|uniref:AAA family ATPase n=1 Tax=Kutzneria sp. NPDC052558 TaxID=3364121 RepID=UPI0037CC560A
MLLERTDELALADEALAGAARGRGSSMLVSSWMGGGKSALLEEIAQRAFDHDVTVLRASAARAERDFAFGLVHQLFERDDLLGEQEEADPAILHELFTALVDKAERRAILLLVDDVQWADAPSLSWLCYLARRIDGAPVALVMSTRDGDPDSEQVAVRELARTATVATQLRPLSPDGVETLVHEYFGPMRDNAFALACHSTSGGNPMMLTLLLNGIRTEHLDLDAERVDAVRPVALGGWVLAALRAQPESVRLVANALAILDSDADLDLIARLTELDAVECASVLRSLSRLGLLSAKRPARLVNRAVAEVIEEAMSTEDYERLHLRAATALGERTGTAEQIVEHLSLVTVPHEQWAVDVLRMAARTAIGRRNGDVGRAHLRRALLISPPESTTRAEILIELAAANRAVDQAAAVRHLRQALPMLPSVHDRAQAVVDIVPVVVDWAAPPTVALVHAFTGQLPESGGVDEQLATSLRARALYSMLGDAVAQPTVLDELDRRGGQFPVDTAADRELTAVLVHAGALTQRMTATQVGMAVGPLLSREHVRRGYPGTAVPLVISSAMAAQRHDIVRSWLSLAIERSRMLDDIEDRLLLLSQLALNTAHSGQLTDLVRHATEALELAGSPDLAGATGFLEPLGLAVLHLVGAGNHTVLIERVAAAYDARLEESLTLRHRCVRQLLATVLATPQTVRPAVERLQDSGRQLTQLGWTNPALLPWRVWLARALFRLGDLDSAASLVEQEVSHARAWSSAVPLGRALRASARLTDGPRAIELLRESMAVLSGGPNRFELAKTLTLLGDRLRTVDQVESEQRLREAVFATAVSSQGWMPAGDEDPRTGRHTEAAKRAGLTATEQQVVDLVLGGRANGEIAAKLGVTRRAVEKHLTKIYRKLDVDGRSGLLIAFAEAKAGQ